jgi:electron transfer flavoprotein beta subunit
LQQHGLQFVYSFHAYGLFFSKLCLPCQNCILYLQLVVYATNFAVSFPNNQPIANHMKILVCVSKTPDTTAKIAFTDGDTKFAEAGVQFIVNPYDEWYALVRALELKEAGLAQQVSLVTVGLADAEPIIRKALAIGGDDAIRVNADSSDSFSIATQIADVAKQGGFDLVLTGKETIDYNGSSIGGMVAELLDTPYISLATKLDVVGSTATITREIEGGEEVAEAQLPLVISCQKGMAEQRIPNMKGIMGARTKPLAVKEPVAVEALTSIARFELPAAKAGVRLVSSDNVEELVRLLHEEAKVI